MPPVLILRRSAALLLAVPLCACGIDWSAPPQPYPVSNASNGEPQPTTSFPRGASPYGNPPPLLALPPLGR